MLSIWTSLKNFLFGKKLMNTRKTHFQKKKMLFLACMESMKNKNGNGLFQAIPPILPVIFS